MKEAELERAIAAELGWEAFDAEKFAKEVERVEVQISGVRAARKEEALSKCEIYPNMPCHGR